ncbi:MAG TPA: ABC transporter permease [Treponema sp.]|nr:ABC transporter permease [Treponema sp.]
MTTAISVLHAAAPLLLVTMGALISEYAGRMAMFLECMINLGAFCCYAFTSLTGNAAAGCALAVLTCTAATVLLERVASRCKANMFLISLALNMLFAAAATFFSATLFGTRGVLYGEQFLFDARSARTATSTVCLIFSAAQLALLRCTGTGLRLRISGSDPDVLAAKGISVSAYRTLAWALAAADAAMCGCALALRLSSYVPGMASGRGWTALAAVFLGKKHPMLVILAVLVFAAAEYASSTAQNLALFRNVPPSILLALPYITALALIVIVPQKAEEQH